jgi:quercetin dioxygenase-like cupin family protein
MTLPFTASAVLLSIVCTSALAQQAAQPAPKENKGLTATLKQAVDLGPEIEGMKGRELRMRILTIEPGGHIGIHSHKDRPAVAYLLQGVDTVIFEDGTTKVLRPGDTASADKRTTHWHRNDGKEPAVLLVVDVFHTSK